MKEIVQKTYYFKNDISKVVFIGEPKAVKKKIDKKLTNSLKNIIVNSDNPLFLILYGLVFMSIISFAFQPFAQKK
jgi:hypothetical protein